MSYSSNPETYFVNLDPTPPYEALHERNSIVVTYSDSRYTHLGYFALVDLQEHKHQLFFDKPFMMGKLIERGVPVIDCSLPSQYTIELYIEYQRQVMERDLALGQFGIAGAQDV